MSILSDVAPYSREYHTFRQKVGQQAQGNTELEIEYEKILTRVKQTRESVIKMNDRHFTEPVDEISGTVDEVSAGAITLNEFPGRRFQFSSVSTSAADMSARILGENNNMTRSEVAAEVDTRRGALQEYLAETRGEHLFPLFATFAKRSRKCRIYFTISMYINALPSASSGMTESTFLHRSDQPGGPQTCATCSRQSPKLRHLRLPVPSASQPQTCITCSRLFTRLRHLRLACTCCPGLLKDVSLPCTGNISVPSLEINDLVI